MLINYWLKDGAGLIGISRGALKINLFLGRRRGNVFYSQKSSLKIEIGAILCPVAMITFLSSIIFGISDSRVISFDAVLWMLRGNIFSVTFSF